MILTNPLLKLIWLFPGVHLAPLISRHQHQSGSRNPTPRIGEPCFSICKPNPVKIRKWSRPISSYPTFTHTKVQNGWVSSRRALDLNICTVHSVVQNPLLYPLNNEAQTSNLVLCCHQMSINLHIRRALYQLDHTSIPSILDLEESQYFQSYRILEYCAI